MTGRKFRISFTFECENDVEVEANSAAEAKEILLAEKINTLEQMFLYIGKPIPSTFKFVCAEEVGG